MKNKSTYSLILAGVMVLTSSCKDFLDYQPKGLLSSENIQSVSGAESLSTAA